MKNLKQTKVLKNNQAIFNWLDKEEYLAGKIVGKKDRFIECISRRKTHGILNSLARVTQNYTVLDDVAESEKLSVYTFLKINTDELSGHFSNDYNKYKKDLDVAIEYIEQELGEASDSERIKDYNEKLKNLKDAKKRLKDVKIDEFLITFVDLESGYRQRFGVDRVEDTSIFIFSELPL